MEVIPPERDGIESCLAGLENEFILSWKEVNLVAWNVLVCWVPVK
jgi:hypothetical protein